MIGASQLKGFRAAHRPVKGRIAAFLLATTAIFTLCHPWPALARTWLVGPDQALKKPSEAAQQAKDGDTVQVEPQEGGYYDCSVWRQNNLIVEGIGNDVRVTDTVCQGKGLFVITGTGVTVRNLTLARARVADGNGAGIRAEGGDLLIEQSRFINNQVGLFANDHAGAMITIRDSEFRDNGTCRENCTNTLSIGMVTVLRVVNSVFDTNHGRDIIRSRAAATELIGNRLEQSDAPDRGYLIELPSGGSILMQQNSLRCKADLPTGAAVLVAEGYGATPVERVIVRENEMIAENAASGTTLVRNWTSRAADESGNKLPSSMRAASDSGYHWFLIKSYLRPPYETIRETGHKALSKLYHLMVRG